MLKNSFIHMAMFVMPLILANASTADKGSRYSHLQRNNEIRLEVVIEQLDFCEGDQEVYTTHLKLKLRYTNLGAQKIILYRPRKPIGITKAYVASDNLALEEKRYQSVLEYDTFGLPKTAPSSKQPDAENFILLDAGNSFEIPATLAVPVRFDFHLQIPGTVSSGDHVISVEVADWPFSEEAGRSLGRAWANLGDLLYEPLISLPVYIRIPDKVQVRDCQTPKASSQALTRRRRRTMLLGECPSSTIPGTVTETRLRSGQREAGPDARHDFVAKQVAQVSPRCPTFAPPVGR